MYLAQCTRLDIAFAVNLLARFSFKPTRRHWNGIKHIFRYLRGTIDLGLYYSKESTTSGLVGYSDAGYRYDPHKARSQTGYLFCYNGTAISWRSTKQSLVATSSNHSEIIALYEAGRECVWLRSIITHIHNSCCLTLVTNYPTIIYEDNAACVAQVTWHSTKQSLVATSSNHSEIIALYEAGRECVWLRSIITHIHNSCCLTLVTNYPTIIYEDNAACVAQVKGGYIKPSISRRNFSILTNSKKVDNLMLSRFNP